MQLHSGMSEHLEFEQWVSFPLPCVFEFFCNPENLPRIMPAAMATKLVTLNRVPALPLLDGTFTIRRRRRWLDHRDFVSRVPSPAASGPVDLAHHRI